MVGAKNFLPVEETVLPLSLGVFVADSVEAVFDGSVDSDEVALSFFFTPHEMPKPVEELCSS